MRPSRAPSRVRKNVGSRYVTAHVVTALATAQVPAKCKLIEVLVTIGGDKALKVVRDAAKDSNADLRRAGYKALGEWHSADAGGAPWPR